MLVNFGHGQGDRIVQDPPEYGAFRVAAARDVETYLRIDEGCGRDHVFVFEQPIENGLPRFHAHRLAELQDHSMGVRAEDLLA